MGSFIVAEVEADIDFRLLLQKCKNLQSCTIP